LGIGREKLSLIFLAGVHGVGKGFLGAPAASTLGISHFTASQIIREEKGQVTWGADKKTADLDDNQSALIRGVTRKRLTCREVLLDGHFVLRNSEGRLTPLEKFVFKELQLAGVVLLTEETQIIVDRIERRDGCKIDASEIFELAEAEYTHARKVCDELKIPIEIVHSPTENTICEAIIRIQNYSFIKK
jgi:adenylate kinase